MKILKTKTGEYSLLLIQKFYINNTVSFEQKNFF